MPRRTIRGQTTAAVEANVAALTTRVATLEAWVVSGHKRDNAVENGPRWSFTIQANGITLGRQYLMYFTPLINITISKMAMINAQLAIGPTLVRFGLYTVSPSTGDLTLVARTANDTTIFATAGNSENQRSFDTTGGYPSSYALVAGTRYAFSYLVIGGSQQPTIQGGLNTGPANAFSAVTPYITRFNSGAPSDLPATLAFSSTTYTQVVFYCAGIV